MCKSHNNTNSNSITSLIRCIYSAQLSSDRHLIKKTFNFCFVLRVSSFLSSSSIQTLFMLSAENAKERVQRAKTNGCDNELI